jgi:hypothetical protein
VEKLWLFFAPQNFLIAEKNSRCWHQNLFSGQSELKGMSFSEVAVRFACLACAHACGTFQEFLRKYGRRPDDVNLQHEKIQ